MDTRHWRTQLGMMGTGKHHQAPAHISRQQALVAISRHWAAGTCGHQWALGTGGHWWASGTVSTGHCWTPTVTGHWWGGTSRVVVGSRLRPPPVSRGGHQHQVLATYLALGTTGHPCWARCTSGTGHQICS